jgi:hypothetical protein
MVLSLELLDLEEAAFFPTQPSSHEPYELLTTLSSGEEFIGLSGVYVLRIVSLRYRCSWFWGAPE